MQKQMRWQRGVQQKSSWLRLINWKIMSSVCKLDVLVWKCDALLELRAFVRGLKDVHTIGSD